MRNNIYREITLKNGDLLIIREPKEDDARAIIEYCNTVGGESDNLTFGKDEFHNTIEQEIDFIKRINEGSNIMMLLGVINCSIVSIANIIRQTKKRLSHNSEIGISVKKDYWRNGIGSIVIEQLINYAKECGEIKNISLGVRATNLNAIKMYEKFGFVKVGVHNKYFNINGVYDDELIMDLYLEESK